MTRYGIYLRNQLRERIAEIDAFTVLDLTLRFNAVGAWRLEMPADANAVQLLAFGGGIIVMRNDTALFSGPLRRLEHRFNSDEDVVVASGPSDLVYLADRLASPTPAGPPYTVAYDVRTGAAETVIKEYVDYNAGAHATAARRIQGLDIVNSQGRGSNPITGRARFDNLLEFLVNLATSGDLGLQLVQRLTTGFPLEFDCTVTQNLTASVVFALGRGTLSAYNYTQAAAEANHIVAGGQGEAEGRVFYEAERGDSVTTYGRIEQFMDKRMTSDAGELAQAVQAALDDKAERFELQVTPLDPAGEGFGTTYQLGDKVTVVVEGSPLQELVRTVGVKLSSDVGETITPYVGTAGLADLLVPALFRKMQDSAQRVRSLERV